MSEVRDPAADSAVLHLLIAEDSPGDARLVVETLRDSGRRFVTHVVPRLSEAVERLRDGCFDAVLLDLALPDSFGLDSLRSLLRARPGAPVLILTGHDDEELAVEAVRQGAQDYLLKDELEPRRLSSAVLHAITRHRSSAELFELATVDQLTGLLNRRGFVDAACDSLAPGHRGRKTGGAVLYVDLDGLKEINDRLGHGVGDEVLRDAAQLLRSSFRRVDLVGRLGGDEFGVVAYGIGENEVDLLIERLRDRLDGFNESRQDGRPELAMSVGTALWQPNDKTTFDALLAAADEAMYQDKRRRPAAGRPGPVGTGVDPAG